MGARYGIKAEMKHYSCMVDLYGKSGEVEKAEKLVRDMPFEPDVGVWGALLAACGLNSSYELANGIEDLARDHPTIYRMLIKLHGEKGAWSRVIEMRNKMMETGAKKLKEVCETNAEYDENITMQQQPPQINSKELNFGPLTFVTAQKARNLWKQKVKPGFRTGRSWLILTAINITIQLHSGSIGKSGNTEKGEKLVKEMPFKRDVGVWDALLAATGLNSWYELANKLKYLARDVPVSIFV
ncbi:pentatricopeptide repeat-containing protein [Tanacetum coccineum]